ncbi:MAG: metal-dependent hydrolase [Candidatus Acidiferrum sp.]
MAPRVSLGLLMAAAVWADILRTSFLLVGWEHARISVGATRWTPLDMYDYPCSHSLLFLALWATALAVVYRVYRTDTIGAVAIWIGVVSHWVLDWLTHRPDMLLYPSGAKHGLGLWNSVPATLVVELLLFAGGVWLYASSTRARDRVGRAAFWAYVLVLLLVYVADRFSGPPASMTEVAITGLIGTLLLVAWPWWFDRHRSPVTLRGSEPSAQDPSALCYHSR